jgi:hypothetical protein
MMVYIELYINKKEDLPFKEASMLTYFNMAQICSHYTVQKAGKSSHAITPPNCILLSIAFFINSLPK